MRSSITGVLLVYYKYTNCARTSNLVGSQSFFRLDGWSRGVSTVEFCHDDIDV
jgi:hypothetical protein